MVVLSPNACICVITVFIIHATWLSSDFSPIATTANKFLKCQDSYVFYLGIRFKLAEVSAYKILLFEFGMMLDFVQERRTSGCSWKLMCPLIVVNFKPMTQIIVNIKMGVREQMTWIFIEYVWLSTFLCFYFLITEEKLHL